MLGCYFWIKVISFFPTIPCAEILSVLHNISNDVSEREDSGSEFDNLYTLKLDLDFSCSDKPEQDFSGSFSSGPRSSNCLPKQSRVQTRLETTEAPQQIDDTDAEVNVSRNEEENDRILNSHLTLFFSKCQ